MLSEGISGYDNPTPCCKVFTAEYREWGQLLLSAGQAGITLITDVTQRVVVGVGGGGFDKSCTSFHYSVFPFVV